MSAQTAGSRHKGRPRISRTNGGGLTLPPAILRAITAFAQAGGLTSRESEVLKLACRGLKNVAIANELGISVPTVRLHLRNAYRKTGAESKLEFVVSAWQWSINAAAKAPTGTYPK